MALGEKHRPQNWLEAVNCAIEGILHVAKTERHMRYHFIVAFLILLFSLFLNVTNLQFIALALTITLVLITEMINTSIEALVDLYIPDESHPLAKIAKDIGAGAVLISSFTAVSVAYLIYSDYLSLISFQRFSPFIKRPPATISFIAVITVLILVIVSKAYLGRGKPLHGGMPSGHAAISFSLWICVVFISKNWLVILLTLILAILVSHSRLLLKIHSKKEVIVGALLGIVYTVLIFLIFG
ncbi:MAG: diacylglycerol kinase [bacterium]